MSNQKKVLFLFCGGTIGQVLQTVEIDGEEHQVLFPPADDSEFQEVCRTILSRVKEIGHLDVTYELVFTKDSANITPEDWQMMVDRIVKAQDNEGYEAVVIAHGTDTMSHTASALSFALHGADPERSGLSIPVIMTGAQNSISIEGGDGRFNLQNVFRVADACIDNGIADVLVSFWSRVLLGCRAEKVSEREFDAFQSLGFAEVGTINSLGVQINPGVAKKRSDSLFRLEPAAKFSNQVLSIELTPGMDPDMIRSFVECGDIKALILKAFGGGNIPIENRYSFIPLIKDLTNAEIPVILSSRFHSGYIGNGHYEVGMKALEAGGIPGRDHTSVAAEIKTRWILGNQLCNSAYGFKKAFETSYVGEVTVKVEKK